jgi:hypothetical protein
MHSFKDSTGREWQLSINGFTNEAVFDKLGYTPIAKLQSGLEKYGDFLEHPKDFFNCLWVMVQGQHPGVTEKDFKVAMDGDPKDAAIRALQEEIIFFSPPQRRKEMAQTFAKLERLGNLLNQEAAKQVGEIDESKIPELLKILTGNSLKNSTDSVASSESTLAPSPTESSS